MIRWLLIIAAFASGMAIAAYANAAAVAPSPGFSLNVCGANQPVFAFERDAAGKVIDDHLQIRCPGSAVVVLTIVGCVGPKIKRTGDTYTLTCASWRGYKQVPA